MENKNNQIIIKEINDEIATIVYSFFKSYDEILEEFYKKYEEFVIKQEKINTDDIYLELLYNFLSIDNPTDKSTDPTKIISNNKVIELFVGITLDSTNKFSKYKIFLRNLNNIKITLLNYGYNFYSEFITIINNYIDLFIKYYDIGKQFDDNINNKYKNNETILSLLYSKLTFNNNNIYYISLPGYKEFIKTRDNILLKLSYLNQKVLKETEIKVSKKLSNISKSIVSNNSEKLYTKSIDVLKDFLRNNTPDILNLKKIGEKKLSDEELSIIINSLNTSLDLCKYFDLIFNQVITNMENIYKDMDFEKKAKNIIIKKPTIYDEDNDTSKKIEDFDIFTNINEDVEDKPTATYINQINLFIEKTKNETNKYIDIIDNTVNIINGFFNINIDTLKLIEVYFNYIFLDNIFKDVILAFDKGNDLSKYIITVDIIKTNLFKIISAIFNLISMLGIYNKQEFIDKFKIIIGGSNTNVFDIEDTDLTNIYNDHEPFIDELKNLYFEIPIIYLGLKNIISNNEGISSLLSNIENSVNSNDLNNEQKKENIKLFNKYSKWNFLLSYDGENNINIENILLNINNIYKTYKVSNKTIDDIKKDFLVEIVESIKNFIISKYNIISIDNDNNDDKNNINLNIELVANKLKKTENYTNIINSINDLLFLYDKFNSLLNVYKDTDEEKLNTNNYVNTYFNLYLIKINKTNNIINKKFTLTEALKCAGDFKNIDINHIYYIKESLIGFLKSSIENYIKLFELNNNTSKYILYDILVNNFNNSLNINIENNNNITFNLNKNNIINNITEYMNKYSSIKKNFTLNSLDKTNQLLTSLDDSLKNITDIKIENDFKNINNISFCYPKNNYDLNDIRLKFKPEEQNFKQPDNSSLFIKNINNITSSATFVDFYNSYYLPFEYNLKYGNNNDINYYYFSYILENINNLNYGLYNITNNGIMITEFIEIFSKNNIQFINNPSAKNALIFNNPIPNYIEVDTNLDNSEKKVEKIDIDFGNNIKFYKNIKKDYSEQSKLLYNGNTKITIRFPIFLLYNTYNYYYYNENSYIFTKDNNKHLNYRGNYAIMRALTNSNLQLNQSYSDILISEINSKIQTINNNNNNNNNNNIIYILIKDLNINEEFNKLLNNNNILYKYSYNNNIDIYIKIIAIEESSIYNTSITIENNDNNDFENNCIIVDCLKTKQNDNILINRKFILSDDVITNISLYNLLYDKKDTEVKDNIYSIYTSDKNLSNLIVPSTSGGIYKFSDKILGPKILLNKNLGNVIEDKIFINPYTQNKETYNIDTQLIITKPEEKINEKNVNILSSIMSNNNDYSQLPLYFKSTLNSIAISDKIMISDNLISTNILSDILFSIMYTLNCAHNIKLSLNIIPDKQKLNIYNRFMNINRNIDYLITSLEECITLLLTKTNNKVIEYLFNEEEREILSFKNIIGYTKDTLASNLKLNKIFLKLFFIDKFIKNVKLEDIITIFTKTVIDNNDTSKEVYNQTIKCIISFYYLLFDSKLEDDIQNVDSNIWKNKIYDENNNKINETSINKFSEKFIKHFNIQIETPSELFNKTGFPNIYLLSYTDPASFMNYGILNNKLILIINTIINKINNIKELKNNKLNIDKEYEMLYSFNDKFDDKTLKQSNEQQFKEYYNDKLNIIIKSIKTSYIQKLLIIFSYIKGKFIDDVKNQYIILNNYINKYKLNNILTIDKLLNLFKIYANANNENIAKKELLDNLKKDFENLNNLNYIPKSNI